MLVSQVLAGAGRCWQVLAVDVWNSKLCLSVYLFYGYCY